VAGVGSSRARKTVAPREPVCDRCRVPQPILRTARLLLVPLAGRHLGLEARLDSDPEVLRYLDRRARSRDEVGEQYAYLQVADDLERRISEGEIEVKLPSERDLAEDYGVAYTTIRRAMEVLRERRLIITRHGRGTFITRGQ
jgi:GntR family transcriptional regulator